MEQNNYLTNIANAYIVYDLNAWTGNPTKSFKFKDCLFGATNIIENSDKERYVYSGYGITLDNADLWSFDNFIIYYFISSLFYFGKNYKIVIEVILFTISI